MIQVRWIGGRRGRRTAVLVAVLLLGGVTVACDLRVAGTPCGVPGAVARDARYVLTCRDSRWRRGPTLAEATLRLIALVWARTPASVATGGSHTCAPMRDGTVRCWGANDHGQLGDGTTVERHEPVLTPFASAKLDHAPDYEGRPSRDDPAGGVLALGAEFTCSSWGSFGDQAMSRMWTACWGAGSSGQLGDGSLQDRPVRGPLLDDTTGWVVVGERHACLLRPAVELRCWGDDARGQLGDGRTMTTSSVPTTSVGAASNASAGGAHTCAVMVGGVACWGANDRGQLGDGTTADRLSPVRPSNFPPASPGQLALGHAHTCVVALGAPRSGGDVWCWGANDRGQLGDDTTSDRTAPVRVTGVRSYRLDADGDTTCAIDDGRVWCWGANDRGQLGDGTTTDRARPTVVPELDGVDAVSVGRAHVCAHTVADRVWCWGANDSGQLGDGTTTERHRPTLVSF